MIVKIIVISNVFQSISDENYYYQLYGKHSAHRQSTNIVDQMNSLFSREEHMGKNPHIPAQIRIRILCQK